MERFTTPGRPADGGYPLDSDLHRMTDDGGSHTPDPARWADPDWRDNFGEWDTFADEARLGFPAVVPLSAGTVTVRGVEAGRRPEVRGPGPLPSEDLDPGDQSGKDLRGPLWASIRAEGPAAVAVFLPNGHPAGLAG